MSVTYNIYCSSVCSVIRESEWTCSEPMCKVCGYLVICAGDSDVVNTSTAAGDVKDHTGRAL